MAQQVIRYRATSAQGADQHVDQTDALLARFAAIRAELHVPREFPPEVVAEAAAAVRAVVLPDRDDSSVPFLTIDPPGSMDLDQALHIVRSRDGYRVRYAIADVPAFVAAGGALDREARERGVTIYAPDERAPLHPPLMSEGAASLLPGQVRPAFVWDMVLDAEAEVGAVDVYRARVRSADRYDYDGVQRDLEAGTDDERLTLLREVGRKRVELERRRGGSSLPMPEQEVTRDQDGHFLLGLRPVLEVEDWNAQISLMTGMAAARLMVTGGVGILRTMPPPDARAVERFRRQAQALGVPWAAEQSYGEFLRGRNRADPRQLALIHEATSLFRGAGYTPFEGRQPDQPLHAAVAAAYAHVTAPLRRLVDRFGLAICAALSAGETVPDWAREALPSLPGLMEAGDARANAVDRACTNAVEAALLSSRVGQTFPAVVVDRTDSGEHVTVQIVDPAILTQAVGGEPLGAEVEVRVTAADPRTGNVGLQVV